ncbi:hypothetical protein SYNPS1DRAFT_27151 [Syncephalis pseudoplumigaleata]|uniref:JmjC domain-containing protein n=1 Tax=Syncephalis pseudoplumigaleata TaxID=1712513 RepID=A0A4P9Z531_9FUNG|nr:hypothetical protein SYNPS1DRAFT_27151 [Syncephalis pseudoplumigaleata]|eukprot:RKP27182.1 hypothetical protein SYNPS1DRAFT_27151 [Syncephalis pseudoplumigaleata]
MALFDGSWFSAMQQLRQVVSLNKPYADVRAQASTEPSRQRFDHAPGPHWPMHIPAVRSWYLYESWRLAHLSLEHLATLQVPATLALDVIPAATLSEAQFQREYNATCTPVIIDGLAVDWPAYHGCWSVEQLVEKWGDATFRVSVEQIGPRPDRISRFHLSMRDYVHYCKHQCDASPIYIFDAGFGERTPAMLDDYKVPVYFQQDYLAALDSPHRPPYRWFVMGPARSGASWHVDPSGTSAWNTLLSGRKRWALYPNHVVPPGVTVVDAQRLVSRSPTSLAWYQDIYPTLPPEQRPLECIQEAGQTIFVPGGWWHMVLNLNETIAVTQNFADDHNLDAAITKQYPHLAPFMAKFNRDIEATTDPLIISEGSTSRQAFIASFKDIALWTPRCASIIARHSSKHGSASAQQACSLPTEPLTLTALSTGQNPVFNVNEHWIVKYYAHLAGGHRAYDMETATLARLSTHPILRERVPRLLVHGHLRDPPASDDQPWPWPYILCEHISGTSLQSLILEDREDGVDWPQVIAWLAETLAALHTSSHEQPSPSMPSATSFRHHLQALAKRCQTQHQAWRHLPPWLIDDIPSFMAPFLQWLEHGRIDGQPTMPIARIEQWLSRGHIVHGDLNAANMLGHAEHASLWRISSMIDFADAHHAADPLWDFIPLHVSVFGGDAEQFRAFLAAYEARVPDAFVTATTATTTAQHPFPLPYILTCYLLLWPYEGVIRWLVSVRSELCACQCIEDMSQQLWLE